MSNLTVDQHYSPRHPQKSGERIQKYAYGSAPGPAPGYPDIFLNITYKIDAKTKLANPATKDHDIKIHVAPFATGLSDAFHAPRHGLEIVVKGSLITFKLYYYCEPRREVKVHLGIKEFLGLDTEVPPPRQLAIVEGWINTITGEADFHSRRFGNFERLRAD